MLCTGWALFLVFAGVGFVALPMDLVREWWGRPRATIARSEYVTRAMGMAKNAQSVKVFLLDKQKHACWNMIESQKRVLACL